MQLTKFTDYGLRILLCISRSRDELYTITELAEMLKVSENHLVKIVHFMAKQNWIITQRGKKGGICLAPATLNLPLGEMVRALQHNPPVVNCHDPVCVLRPHCRLKSVLDQAVEQFYQSLNQYQFRQFTLNSETFLLQL